MADADEARSAEWWSEFGADYDGAGRDAQGAALPSTPAAATDGSPPPPPPPTTTTSATALEDQLSLNARTLAQLRAKSQCLEVAEASAARMRVDLAETRAAGESREMALQAALDEARSTADALQGALDDAARETARCRASAAEARAALESQAADHEYERAALARAAREAAVAREVAEKDALEARTLAQHAEAERGALRTALEEERGGGALDRLSKLLVRTEEARGADATIGVGGGGAYGLDGASVAARIEELSRWAEGKVLAAQAKADAAEAEAARLVLELSQAPRPEVLRTQAEQAAEARASSRSLATQLKAAQKEMATSSVRLAAMRTRAEAAEAALASVGPGVTPPTTTATQPPSSLDAQRKQAARAGGGDGARWERPTSASEQRRANAPTRGVAAAAARRTAAARTRTATGGGAGAVAAASTEELYWEAAVQSAAASGGGSRQEPRSGAGSGAGSAAGSRHDPTADGAPEEMGEVLATMLEFLRAAAVAVDPPLPAGAAELAGGFDAASMLRPDSEAARAAVGSSGAPAAAADLAGASDAVGDAAHGALVIRARAAAVLEKQRAYVELAHRLGPMVSCVSRCLAALRSRRMLRSPKDELGDGSLEGIASEVEGLVAAEASRAADLAGAPQGVAQHVLRRLQVDLDVGSVGEIAPRIAELTRAARLSLSLLRQLRQALDLGGDATIGMCVAAAGRTCRSHATFTALCAHLCTLLEVRSVEAIVPAVRQMCLVSRRVPPAHAAPISAYAS
jgi:hypothetical protein